MSDFPSLNDLVSHPEDKKTPSSTSRPQRKPVVISGITGKFSKRMGEIKHNEREHESMVYAQQTGFPHINLEKFPVSHESLRQISREKAQQLGAVCFYSTPEEIRIGALDPTMKEVQEFSKELLKFLPDYEYIAEHIPSRAVLIAKKSLNKKTFIDFNKFFELINSGKEFKAKDYSSEKMMEN